jgi:heme oxygenase
MHRNDRDTPDMLTAAARMPAATHLRTATRAMHDTVDAAFSRFDLTARAGYAHFLRAHAEATAAVEGVLTEDATLPRWRPRLPLLLGDLAAIGVSAPPPLPFALPASAAARLGALYVLEGSRLGGALLERQVFAGAPRAFLSARHEPGEWRLFLQTLETRATGQAADWFDDLAAGAVASFALYAEAAQPSA